MTANLHGLLEHYVELANSIAILSVAALIASC